MELGELVLKKQGNLKRLSQYEVIAFVGSLSEDNLSKY